MKAIIQHLRFGFSLLILPTYIYALAFVPNISILNTLLVFIVMHVLVYPSSNAYNSVNDQDEGSIGLIEQPMPVPKQLSSICLMMDLVAAAASFYLHWIIGICVLACIIMSRAYSYRPIRLKKYALLSYIIVASMQGGFTFIIFYLGSFTSPEILLKAQAIDTQLYLHALVCTFFIGAIYPLTQIYQHEQDKADGVITISARLGIRGTFVFAAIMFLLATLTHCYLCMQNGDFKSVFVFFICTSPSTFYFINWFRKAYQNEAEANFKNVLKQSVLSCICLLIYFSYYFIQYKL
jgi:1,4-dihydroxy-2-naphthoate polyprenyltransferase